LARSGLDFFDPPETGRRQPDYQDVPVIPRKRFVQEFGKLYQSGQHATFLGPSGRGKTKLVHQLVMSVTRYHPEIEPIMVHGKIRGRDATVETMSREARMPLTPAWPPSAYHRRVKHRDAKGWIVRPLEKPGDDEAQENELLRAEFAKAIRHCYHTGRKHPKIIIVNETHQAHNDLRLRGNCEAPLMRGRPDCAVWSEIQRARHVSYMCYDQAEHVFIFYDPDVDNQRRYSEIGGGSDPAQLRYLANELQHATRTVADGSTISPCLYFRRSGNILCIVDT
jgi:hypothetical protein